MYNLKYLDGESARAGVLTALHCTEDSQERSIEELDSSFFANHPVSVGSRWIVMKGQLRW